MGIWNHLKKFIRSFIQRDLQRISKQENGGLENVCDVGPSARTGLTAYASGINPAAWHYRDRSSESQAV